MSLRKAINAMCRDCTYDPLDNGSAAQQILAARAKAAPSQSSADDSQVDTAATSRAYKIAPAELDTQARALITPSLSCPSDGQNKHLLDSGSTFKPHLRR